MSSKSGAPDDNCRLFPFPKGCGLCLGGDSVLVTILLLCGETVTVGTLIKESI